MQEENKKEPTGKARGGKARAAGMTPEERKASSAKAIAARKELATLPIAEYGSSDTPLRIGDAEIQCYVLSTGERVLSQRGVFSGLGMSTGAADRLLNFVGGDRINPFLNKEVIPLIENPIKFRNKTSGGVSFGYPATILADICDAILAARKAGTLQKQQAHVADQAEILVRGFARVGIVALVDEATGYQKSRERDALAKILEAFVAKELQPWVHTFQPDYYEQMCRLRGVEYPPQKRNFPSYFGTLTNKIVYDRLAPGLRDELKQMAAKSKRKGKLHQHLTQEIGHPKLREHLSSVITIMKLSDTYEDFENSFEKIHPELPKMS